MDEIEDIEEESLQSLPRKVFRRSLNIEAPSSTSATPDRSERKAKSVTLSIPHRSDDARFRPVPRFKVSSDVSSPNTGSAKAAARTPTAANRDVYPSRSTVAFKETISSEMKEQPSITNLTSKLPPTTRKTILYNTTSKAEDVPSKTPLATESRTEQSHSNVNPNDIPTFISKLGDMWSPERKPSQQSWSFFHNPPQPSTPLKILPPLPLQPILTKKPKSSETPQPSSENSSPPRIDAEDEQSLSNNNPFPDVPRSLNTFRLKHHPPTVKQLYEAWPAEIPEREYKDPYFSNPADASKTKTFSNRRIKVFNEQDLSSAPLFGAVACEYTRQYPWIGASNLITMERLKQVNGLSGVPARPFVDGTYNHIPLAWKLAKGPPSKSMAEKWLKENPELEVNSSSPPDTTQKKKKSSQLEGPTQKNKYGYKYSQIQTEALDHEVQHLVMMSVEILTRAMTESERVLENLPKVKLPNPVTDSIQAVFYCFQGHDTVTHGTNGHRAGYHVGMIIVADAADEDDGQQPMPASRTGISGYPVTSVETELQLYEVLLEKIREIDPDILMGYEVHLSSWGYLIERAKVQYKYDFLKDLSRMEVNVKTKFGRDQDPFSYTDTSAISCSGRIFLNVWRLMRSELTLTSYTLENCVFHVLHERIPKFSPATLYSWFSAKGLKRWRSLVYYLDRVQYTLDLLDDTSFISRSCEFARVYGIDLFSVISQSILSRITRPENFVQISPTKEQVRNMRAIECLPLIKEPQTRFYKNPLAVLDFQSLYPSVMIGYNICYSTCLGRLRDLGGPKKFGVLPLLDIPLEIVNALKDHLYITHNGVIFVKSHIREGALGRMLKEILDTRVMVKTAMKSYKNDTALLRILEARQLGLKLVANVTYGYAGASFSGRMPCAEIADSIVETGRRSLEAAMKLVTENQNEWGGTVVYGDTDSLFVELPGKSLESAFRIGIDIAKRVSLVNPNPMKLKFEKIYLPCILLAKKRYVGFMYENIEDKEPVFDAKGIETVRRDGFPGMAKMVEDALKILFRTQDMSELKAYLYRQWDKILSHRVPLNELIIATEFKLKNYRNVPPGVALCMRSMEYDKRTEPQAGERIPYIICQAKDTRYSGRSYVPLEVAKDRTLKPDGKVYVTKTVQALSRIFKLVGIDVESWYNMMPKKMNAVRFSNTGKQAARAARGQFKIDQFYQSNQCVICNEPTANESTTVCESCKKSKPHETIANLYGRLSELERKRDTLQSVCRSCSMQPAGMNLMDAKCISIECPVLFVRVKASQEYSVMKQVLTEAIKEVTTE
ncbi:hypothetical protein BDR26DRAFT_864543 [Obelidium mucronatum]|nr:hypothetical protein BDR26DRAFT_864543 [Obelidium mucronatum]